MSVAQAAAAVLLVLMAAPWIPCTQAGYLANYTLCTSKTFPEMGFEASGAAYAVDTGTWWVVVGHGKQSALFELAFEPSQGFRLLRTLPLSLPDPEGVAWISAGTLLVADEASGSVYQVVVNQADKAAIVKSIKLSSFTYQNNKGLEGIACTPGPGGVGGSCLLAQEDSPRRVMSLDLTTGQWQDMFVLDTATPSTVLQETRKKLHDISDMSMTSDGRLFLLSQASRRVAEVNRSGAIMQQLRIPAARPEGLAFTPDGRYMLIASEGAADQPSTVYMYAADGQC